MVHNNPALTSVNRLYYPLLLFVYVARVISRLKRSLYFTDQVKWVGGFLQMDSRSGWE